MPDVIARRADACRHRHRRGSRSQPTRRVGENATHTRDGQKDHGRVEAGQRTERAVILARGEQRSDAQKHHRNSQPHPARRIARMPAAGAPSRQRKQARQRRARADRPFPGTHP